MFAKAISGAVVGIDAELIEVQCDIALGLPTFTIVGLPQKEVQESRERIRSALKNAGFDFPAKRITVNLAPADLPKEGVGLDLPLALAILVATGQISGERLAEFLSLGELSLDGEVRPVKGVLPIALAARKNNLKGVIVPMGNAKEAAIVSNLEVYAVENLQQAIAFLNGELQLQPVTAEPTLFTSEGSLYDCDLSEIRGQEQAKRALEVAAAGGHNILLIGPPGSGKSMLAKRLPTILPPLSFDEALEVTKIYSILGLLPADRPLMLTRPFRAPHHTISYAGMVGGGHGLPRPGEISLAHHGVLFLDELPEFEREVLETLRQPLEERQITLSRAAAALTFPANFMLVAAMNPCPCGHRGDPKKPCRCSPLDVKRYRRRISGPFLDRIDIFIEVPRLTKEELMGKPVGESSAIVRARVERARAIQSERFRGEKIFANAQMGVREVRLYCPLEQNAQKLLERAIDHFNLSARGYHRVLKVARTIADLEESEIIRAVHVAEAIQYRHSEESLLEGGM
ncbi:MAG: YifB family Mg chelatase-like AAA ATPase [Candidatus Bipolaricaulota bacterium]|nr:YifB family Mg chelatase-like AAA ATPase [Candidatus Bipolaricaulota bacterium]MDW8031453.1 YifB family Mg chelatase-like AAA ATPase [Candidatus Bipolaricaulota bacterium]